MDSDQSGKVGRDSPARQSVTTVCKDMRHSSKEQRLLLLASTFVSLFKARRDVSALGGPRSRQGPNYLSIGKMPPELVDENSILSKKKNLLIALCL